MSKRKLTTKQELFVIEYAKDFNATQAAIRAGYSERNAAEIGFQLVQKTKDFIDVKKAEVIAKAQVSLEQWVQIVTKLALYDPRKLFDKFGNPQEIPELGRLSAMAVAGFEVEELFAGQGESRVKTGYCRKVKLLDRTPYVMALGKYLGAFPTAKDKPHSGGALQRPRFDLSKLSEEEFKVYLTLKRKSQVEHT